MLESIIRTAVHRASMVVNAEEYLLRLRNYVESDIRHQIKQYGGKQSFDINTRFHLGYNDVDGFYQEICTNVLCTGTTREMAERVRIQIKPNDLLGALRGFFHHASIKAKLASDYYFSNGEIITTKTNLQNELRVFFGNHKAIVVLNHSTTGNCAVDVELIHCSLKNLSNVFNTLENSLPDEPVSA